MKELQQKRDQAARNLHAAEDQLAGLVREQQRVAGLESSGPGTYSANEATSNRTQVSAVSGAARLAKAIDSLKRDISAKRGDLAAIDREIAFYCEITGIADALPDAIKNAEDARQTLFGLEAKSRELAERLEVLQVEATSALNKAERYEKTCAQDYTEALTSGLPVVEAAGEKLRKATSALAGVKQQNEGKQQVFRSLESELQTLNARTEAAAVKEQEAQQAAYRAVAVKLGIKWDRAVDQLLKLGAQLLAARQLAGMASGELDHLNIPRFSSYHATPAIHRELKGAAAAVSPENLLAA